MGGLDGREGLDVQEVAGQGGVRGVGGYREVGLEGSAVHLYGGSNTFMTFGIGGDFLIGQSRYADSRK